MCVKCAPHGTRICHHVVTCRSRDETARSSISCGIASKNYSKLTNFRKLTRIEGYNGKHGSNPQGIKEFLDVIFKFDQIG